MAPQLLLRTLTAAGMVVSLASCGLVAGDEISGPPSTSTPQVTTTTVAPLRHVVSQDVSLATIVPPELPCEPVEVPDSTFASGKAELLGPVASLNEFARQVIEVADLGLPVVISIVGHTDNVPTSYPGGNQGLSEARAHAAYDYLIDHGVQASWITQLVGLADAQPIADNNTPTGRAANRRVEVAFQC